MRSPTARAGRWRTSIAVCGALVWGALAEGAQEVSVPPTPAVAPAPDGARLFRASCQGCHLLPELDALDRGTWMRETLKAMAPWLGLSRLNYDRMPDGEALRSARIFPDQPVLTLEEWRALMAHVAAEAPEQMPLPPPRPPAREGLQGFRVEKFQLGGAPFITLLQIDPARRSVWVGDGQDRSLREVESTGRVRSRLPVPSGPVSMTRLGDRRLLTLVGRVLPSDELAGQVWSVDTDGAPESVVRLLEGLRRPVHTSVADLDQDGRDDLVVSAFGNRLGQLSWFRRRGDGGWEEEVLEPYPGTLASIPTDWNRDGRTDLLVLRGQAREGLSVLLNDGSGGFTLRRLVDQPPTFGMVALELADLDRDGENEVLVVNGDSGDAPSPPKGYHGLRLYHRTTDGGLEQRLFFPLHGAYGVRVRDFDRDGDLDVALISFFADYGARPLESFILLRNQGEGRFEAETLGVEDAGSGRWLVMDAGDLDGDGDDDVVLGSFARGPATLPIPAELQARWVSGEVSVLVLRNQAQNGAASP